MTLPNVHARSPSPSRAVRALRTRVPFTAPSRARHSRWPPPQVAGACPLFPSYPLWEPTLLPHPLPGGSLELVIVSPLPKFRLQPQEARHQVRLYYRNQKWARQCWWLQSPAAPRPRGYPPATAQTPGPSPAGPCSLTKPRWPSLCLRAGNTQCNRSWVNSVFYLIRIHRRDKLHSRIRNDNQCCKK